MTIRERLANWMNPQQQDQIAMLSEAVRLMTIAQQEKWTMAPEDMIGRLREQGHEAAYLLDLITQIEWETIGTRSTRRQAERQRIVEDSQRQWIHNPLYQWAIWIWTNYGFGQQVAVVPEDENAIDVWDEFWMADRNDPVLAADNVQQLSIDALKDGNVFFAYHASDQDGETTVTTVNMDEIVEIITHPRNDQQPIFYKREFTDLPGTSHTWYYPDWLAFFSGIIDAPFNGQTLAEALKVPEKDRTDKMGIDADTLGRRNAAGTVTVMQHVNWNRKERDDLFGWPLSTAAGPWLRSQRQYMANRLTVSASKAMYVRKMIAKSGSRGVQSVISTIASNLSRNQYLDRNPPATAGSTLVHNAAIDSEELPMRTGADDAKTDNEMFTWFPSLALGLYPHYAGLGDAYRLATATSMEKPLEMQWDRYRSFWTAQFRRMVRIVLEFSNMFTGTKFDTGSVVTMDRITEIDLDGASSGISRIFSDVFQPALDSGIMNAKTYGAVVQFVVTYFLEALGGNDLAQKINVKLAQEEKEEGVSKPQEEMSAQSKMMVEAMRNYLEGTISRDDTIAYLVGVMAEQGER